MACTITVNESAVQHTLPDYFVGSTGAANKYLDGQNPNFLALVKDIGYEIHRPYHGFWNGPPGDPATLNIFQTSGSRGEYNALALYDWLYHNTTTDVRPKVLPKIAVYPVGRPLATATGANHPYTVQPPTSGDGSIQRFQDTINWYISRYGLNWIHGVAAFNEPAATESTSHANWSPDSGGATNASWCVAQTKPVGDAIHAVDSSLKHHAWQFAAATNYYNFVASVPGSFTDFVTPATPLGGVAFPRTAASHRASVDVMSFHIYASGYGFADDQGGMNAWYYPSWDGNQVQANWNTSAHKSFYLGTMREMRTRMDAAGMTNVSMCQDEYFLSPSTSTSNAYVTAAVDIAQAIISCRHQAEVNLDYFELFAVNCNDRDSAAPGAGDFIIYWDRVSTNQPYNPPTLIPNYTMGIRGYSHMRQIVPFVRRYKRQLIGHNNMATAVVNGAQTPPTVHVNSCGRVQAVCGLTPSGQKIGWLIQNVDLTNSETVNLNWTHNSASNITGYSLKTGIAYWGQDLPTRTIVPSTPTTASFTLAATESVFLEMDLATTPTITGNSTSGDWTTLSIDV